MPRERPESIQLELGALTLADEGKGEEKKGPRRFSMAAYTGKPFDFGFGEQAVIDLVGLEAPEDGVPAFMQHNPEKWVGRVDQLDNNGKSLDVEGFLFDDDEDSQKVKNKSDQGGKWQASVGVKLDWLALDEIGEESKAEVNGRTLDGPLLVFRKTKLKECSFVPLGADDETSAMALEARRRAHEERPMPETNKTDPVAAERERVKQINAAWGEADPTFALLAISEGWTLTEAKAERATQLEAQLATEREERAKEKAEHDKALAEATARADERASRPSAASLLSRGAGDATAENAAPEARSVVEEYEAELATEVARLKASGSQGFRRILPFPTDVNLRTQAVHNIAREKPDLHKRYLEAAESRRVNLKAAHEALARAGAISVQ